MAPRQPQQIEGAAKQQPKVLHQLMQTPVKAIDAYAGSFPWSPSQGMPSRSSGGDH